MKAALQDKLRILRSYTTLIVLFMGGGCIYILPYLSTYLYIPMKDAMHLDNTQIGLMGSAMGFTSMIFYWPGGWMADLFSPRKLISFSLVIQGLLGLWLATLPSFKVLLTIQLLMGVFLTLTYWSAMIKMVRLLASSDQQGRYFGILEAGRNLTAVVVVAAGLYLFDWLGSNSNGLRWTIVLFSAVLLALGLLSWVCLPATTATGTTVADDKGKIPLRVAIGRVVRIPAVWLAMLIILCAYVTSAGQAYFTPYATDVYKQSVVFGGVLSMIITSTGIFAPASAGFLADRWTTSRTIVWLFVALASCLMLFVIVPGGPHLFPLLLINSILIGCVFFALRGIYFALLEEGAIPVALTGIATGLISLVAYTPDVFIPAIAGHLLDRYPAGGLGYRYFFLMLAVFAVAGVGLTLLFRRRISVKLAGGM
jgi:predicted MFS family arabinose efflux permease